MALSISQTIVLNELLRPGMKVAAMGYPDLIAPMDIIEENLEDPGKLQFREDSADICKRHGISYRSIPYAESLLSLRGCSLDVYDIVRERGCEILCDLNEELVNIHSTYDVVLDVGTLEHCFNISQAIMNMAGLVKTGGYIIHENPFNWGNHGFYNLNPTFFSDFYLENGFDIMDCRLVDRDGVSFSVPPTKRFVFTRCELNVFSVAKRSKMQSFVYPVQSKYRKLIPAAGDRANVPPTNGR